MPEMPGKPEIVSYLDRLSMPLTVMQEAGASDRVLTDGGHRPDHPPVRALQPEVTIPVLN
jgi:hypothetical protein